MSNSQWIGALCVLTLASAIGVPKAAATSDFNAGRAAFGVRFGDELISHRVMAVVLLPDSSAHVSVDSDLPKAGYHVRGPSKALRPLAPGTWEFSAPSEPGLYPLTITDAATGATVQLQVFVLTPWTQEAKTLNGYELGEYELTARHGLERYEPPRGFIRVTSKNKDALVAPHFRLHQFLCKQTESTPQYALLHTRLLKRLERVLAAVNEAGHQVSTLHVMSGYRTPKYNRAIGNTTEYSRHLYGDAADVFVDTDGDLWMDDLTGDGRTTRADARHLAEIVKSLPTPGDDAFDGGLGIYGTAAHRGPFVHLDLRGYRARW